MVPNYWVSWYHPNENYRALLSCAVVYYSVQDVYYSVQDGLLLTFVCVCGLDEILRCDCSPSESPSAVLSYAFLFVEVLFCKIYIYFLNFNFDDHSWVNISYPANNIYPMYTFYSLDVQIIHVVIRFFSHRGQTDNSSSKTELNFLAASKWFSSRQIIRALFLCCFL